MDPLSPPLPDLAELEALADAGLEELLGYCHQVQDPALPADERLRLEERLAGLRSRAERFAARATAAGNGPAAAVFLTPYTLPDALYRVLSDRKG